jgi:AcrR family transcriptional regulator
MNASSKPLDLRIRRTYKYLWEALIYLMVERDFESITVTDICERAMVHRTTFYKHYEDKYGLLYHGIQDQLNLLFEELKLPAGQPADMTEETSAVERLTAMFVHVEKQERFYRLMLCGNGVGKFYTLFRESLVNHFLRRSDAHGRRELLTRSTLRAYSHAGVLVSTIAWWLDNQKPYTPAEMGRYLWEDSFS